MPMESAVVLYADLARKEDCLLFVEQLWHFFLSISERLRLHPNFRIIAKPLSDY